MADDPQTSTSIADQYDQHLAQLISMGFHPMKAGVALRASEGKVDGAIAYLLSMRTGDMDEEDAPQPTSLNTKREQRVIQASDMNHQGRKHVTEESTQSSNRRESRQRILHQIPGCNLKNEEGLLYSQQDPKTWTSSKSELEVSCEPNDKLSGELATDLITTLASPSPAGHSPSSTSHEPALSPGAQAISAVGISPETVPSQSTAHTSGGDTVLVSAQIVSEDEYHEPGPLILATPAPDENTNQRDIRRLYVLVLVAIVLVMISTVVAVTLVITLDNNDGSGGNVNEISPTNPTTSEPFTTTTTVATTDASAPTEFTSFGSTPSSPPVDVTSPSTTPAPDSSSSTTPPTSSPSLGPDSTPSPTTSEPASTQTPTQPFRQLEQRRDYSLQFLRGRGKKIEH